MLVQATNTIIDKNTGPQVRHQERLLHSEETHFLCGKGTSQFLCSWHRGHLPEEGGDTREG